MDILDKIDIKPIQQTDPRAFAGFDVNGLIRQAEPIAQRDSLLIVGLESNTVYELDMSNYLGHDLLVTSISIDIVNDDTQLLEPGNKRPSYINAQLNIQLINRLSKHVENQMSLVVSSNGRNIPNDLIFLKDGLYKIKLSQSVNSISILGVPVVIGNTQIAYNLPVFDPQTPI